MTDPIEKDVQQCFPYLFKEFGFKFVNIENDFSGNVAIARFDNILIRFVRDRADFFLDIAMTTKPENWMGFYSIMDKMKECGVVSVEYKYDNRMKPVAKLLQKYFPEILHYLDPKHES